MTSQIFCAYGRGKMVALSEYLSIEGSSSGMVLPPGRSGTLVRLWDSGGGPLREDERRVCNPVRQYRILLSLRRQVTTLVIGFFGHILLL